MTRNEIERAALLEKERLEDERADRRYEKADRKHAYANRLIDRLREFQEKHKLSQKQLADVMDDNSGNISKILNGTGEKRYLSPYHINRICKEYGITADHFIMDDFPEETHAAHDICQATGLSEAAANTLQILAAVPDIYGKQVLHCINTLLEAVDPDRPLDSALYAIFGYICSDFAIVDDPFDPDIKGLQVRASAPDGTSEVRNLDPIKQKLFRMMYQEDLLEKLNEIANKKRNQ